MVAQDRIRARALRGGRSRASTSDARTHAQNGRGMRAAPRSSMRGWPVVAVFALGCVYIPVAEAPSPRNGNGAPANASSEARASPSANGSDKDRETRSAREELCTGEGRACTELEPEA